MALTLTRKAGESVEIGENVKITVTEVSGGRVRLQILAPGDVPIVRSEIKRDSPPDRESGKG